jgi:nucleoside-diphosphate-sugar epimerase
MSKGLENVLAASRRHKVSRFIHMSSVAIYGNNPPPESRYEDAPGCPGQMLYGQQKLRQEKRVLAYYRRHGLPVVILRPPNVYGPHSAFTTGLIQKIKTGKLAIVDGGHNPCNLVYIDNLIEAILRALWRTEAVGQAFFITDKNVVTWARVLRDHANLAGVSVVPVSSADLRSPPPKRLIRDTLVSLPRVVFSGEFRSVLRQVPLLGRIEGLIYNRFEALPVAVKEHLRQAINGPQRFSKMNGSDRCFDQNDNILAAQGRTVAHSSEKAMRLLGYSADVDYDQGMMLTAAWLRYAQWI